MHAHITLVIAMALGIGTSALVKSLRNAGNASFLVDIVVTEQERCVLFSTFTQPSHQELDSHAMCVCSTEMTTTFISLLTTNGPVTNACNNCENKNNYIL